MTTNVNVGSAKIYQFPPRGRFQAVDGTKVGLGTVLGAKVMHGGSWYHEEAVEKERAHND